MDTKGLRHFEIKDAARGEVTAVFATFNVVDSDGDVTVPGAFDDGAQAAISAYGHKSWEGALPAGVARIRSTADEAILEGRFFMDTDHGRDTFLTVQHLHAAGLGQWSYGYDPVDYSHGDFAGRKVRFLRKLLVHEVSPVLIGAGVGTRTLSAKSATPSGRQAVQHKTSIRPHSTDVVSKAWDAAAAVAAIPDDASVTDLRSLFAWVDPGQDPETKSAYQFPHHHGPGGAANIRACLAGIATLNGARSGTAIADADRDGVYEHLAAHLRDADREPPQLRKAGDGAGLKFNEEAAVVMADLSAFLDRAAEVMALRATKGKGLAPASVELLQWLDDDMRRLRSLLDTPDDEAAREYLRFVQQTTRGEST